MRKKEKKEVVSYKGRMAVSGDSRKKLEEEEKRNND